MIRILYIINNLDVGGAERHLLQVVPRLKQHGLEPVVFTVGQKGKLSSRFEEAGVKVVEPLFATTTRSWPRSITGPFTIIGSALSLLVFMWRFRPQFIHFFLPHAYVLGCLVSFFHMGSHRIMSRRSLNVYQLRHPFAAKVERLLHPSLDAALGNSQKVVEQLASEGIDRKRLGLIYNGLDIAAFRSASDTREVRRALGISCRSLVLILVANLIPYKGHLDLLQALASVKDELPDGWRMLCVGRDTGIGGSLRDEAQRLGVGDHVVWLGERRDISDLLAASDIGLLTSHEEGFSNSILEGMAAGLPMVVTDVGGQWRSS